MMNKALVLAMLLSFSSTLLADDFETKTESKTGGAGPGAALPADGGKLPPPAKAPSAGDHALRAKIRAKAPFWIDDSAHGAAVRLNKDGTFSSEAQGGGSIAGQWKAQSGEVHLQWADGGDKYSYPVGGKGKELLIRGAKAKKGRYHLN